MTEEQIERRVEIATDRYDSMFISGAISQSEYNSFMHDLARWADGQYHLIDKARTMLSFNRRDVLLACDEPERPGMNKSSAELREQLDALSKTHKRSIACAVSKPLNKDL